MSFFVAIGASRRRRVGCGLAAGRCSHSWCLQSAKPWPSLQKKVRYRQVRHVCDQSQFLEQWRYYEAEKTTADFDELRFLVCYMPLAAAFSEPAFARNRSLIRPYRVFVIALPAAQCGRYEKKEGVGPRTGGTLPSSRTAPRVRHRRDRADEPCCAYS